MSARRLRLIAAAAALLAAGLTFAGATVGVALGGLLLTLVAAARRPRRTARHARP